MLKYIKVSDINFGNNKLKILDVKMEKNINIKLDPLFISKHPAGFMILTSQKKTYFFSHVYLMNGDLYLSSNHIKGELESNLDIMKGFIYYQRNIVEENEMNDAEETVLTTN